MPRSFPPRINAGYSGHRTDGGPSRITVVAAISIFVATLLLVMLLREEPLRQGWLFALFGLTVLLPYAIWLAVVLHYDHWTQRPRNMVMLAVGWGSLLSIAVAAFLEQVFGAIAESWGVPNLDMMVIAPFWEEFAKGAFIVLLYVFVRRYLRGLWDGLVYGVLVGAGFGFAEDVAYLDSRFSDDGISGLVITYVIRCVFTTHVHPMFTAATGLATGMAAQRGLPLGRALLWILGGFLIAFALHAIYDSATVLVPYAGLVVPLIFGPVYGVVFVIALRRLRRQEDALLRSET